MKFASKFIKPFGSYLTISTLRRCHIIVIFFCLANVNWVFEKLVQIKVVRLFKSEWVFRWTNLSIRFFRSGQYSIGSKTAYWDQFQENPIYFHSWTLTESQSNSQKYVVNSGKFVFPTTVIQADDWQKSCSKFGYIQIPQTKYGSMLLSFTDNSSTIPKLWRQQNWLFWDKSSRNSIMKIKNSCSIYLTI